MSTLSDDQLAARHYDVANQCLARAHELQAAADKKLAEAQWHEHKAELLTRSNRAAHLG